MPDIGDLRTRCVLPIGTVIQLTDLTARQIRYYEAQDLVHPERTAGNHRMYSLNHIDTLLEIKSQLADGFTLADIKQLMHPRHREPNSDEEVRQMLRDEMMNQSRLNQANNVRQGFGFRP
ncbi:MerR family transcriptional regulator [Lacticaseibacillus porcinae]|uniref:MerR family transcriptional regulator n=1 Tax=Lacticaseibacillus porcinae TaxID=1123687 RepID=UPI000F7A65F9|nr:MerR family transcriptional regulator [Lacticaseibacillus porcinae]